MRPSLFSICTRIGQGAVIAMALFITTDVILRFIFNRPLFFATDVAGFLLLVMSFLGLAHAERTGAHVSFKTVVKLLPENVKSAFSKVVWLIEFGWAIILAVCTYMIAKDFYLTHTTSVSTGWLLYPFALFMVVGSLLLVFELAGENRGIISHFRRRQTADKNKGEQDD
jgi:C4-dicarboxylate transporter DctQ subunit